MNWLDKHNNIIKAQIDSINNPFKEEEEIVKSSMIDCLKQSDSSDEFYKLVHERSE